MNKSVYCCDISRRLPDMSKCLSGTQTTGRSKSKWDSRKDSNTRQNWRSEWKGTSKYNDLININIIYISYYYNHLCMVMGINGNRGEFKSKVIVDI
jgi:hypothetical protein